MYIHFCALISNSLIDTCGKACHCVCDASDDDDDDEVNMNMSRQNHEHTGTRAHTRAGVSLMDDC